jgi:hypothetical protein
LTKGLTNLRIRSKKEHYWASTPPSAPRHKKAHQSSTTIHSWIMLHKPQTCRHKRLEH